jgi:hypothetical protein
MRLYNRVYSVGVVKTFSEIDDNNEHTVSYLNPYLISAIVNNYSFNVYLKM